VRLLSLSCESFRNLSRIVLAPSPSATIAVGENGQGKTNLLEALYYLATLRPLRANTLKELVQFGAVRARVEGRWLLGGAERVISVEISHGTRTAFVDGKKAASLDAYFGGVSVVAFTPDDLSIVKGGPDGRRSFLDRSVFNRYPAYLSESRDYARALKARNRLLKEHAPATQLGAWDETLARLGARLWTRRRSLLAEVAPLAALAFEKIARIEAKASFRYEPSLDEVDFDATSEAGFQDTLAQALKSRLPRDLERGHTSVGPHVDDVAISLGEHAARQFASQGQSRALVLAWKIAEIENLKAANGFLPLLLLDDVSSELDPERNAYLMRYLAESGAQTLLTTTDAQLVRTAADPATVWLKVSAGTVTAQSPYIE
jgi:DNA replication and repair protein RecF